jgi:hypothetical protein
MIMAGLVITENGRVITRLMARDHGPGVIPELCGAGAPRAIVRDPVPDMITDSRRPGMGWREGDPLFGKRLRAGLDQAGRRPGGAGADCPALTETSMRILGAIRRDHGWSAGDGNEYAG